MQDRDSSNRCTKRASEGPSRRSFDHSRRWQRRPQSNRRRGEGLDLDELIKAQHLEAIAFDELHLNGRQRFGRAERLAAARSAPADAAHSHGGPRAWGVSEIGADPSALLLPGLRHAIQDLVLECLKQLDATGTVARFPLGRHDTDGGLRIPQKLYGSAAERASTPSSA